jgi:hypothetical protein
MDRKPVLSRFFPLFALLAILPGVPRALAADQTPPQDWMPAGIDQFARTASSHTDFTFDKNMLQMGSALVDGGDPDTRAAIAKLNGVTIHLYHYAQPGMYDPHQLDAIRAQYHAAGWKHLVGEEKPAPAPGVAQPGAPPPPYPSQAAPAYPTAPPPPILNALDQPHTDLYIKFQGMDVVGMVLVQATPRNLNVVALSGDLSPIDLLHLRGHFGIPKFAGDGFTPQDN